MEDKDITKALEELLHLKKKIANTKQKQSQATKDKWKDPEWRKKVMDSRKGGNLKRWTAEYRKEWSKKMQDAKKVKKQNSKAMQSDPSLDDLKKKYGFEK